MKTYSRILPVFFFCIFHLCSFANETLHKALLQRAADMDTCSRYYVEHGIHRLIDTIYSAAYNHQPEQVRYTSINDKGQVVSISEKHTGYEYGSFTVYDYTADGYVFRVTEGIVRSKNDTNFFRSEVITAFDSRHRPLQVHKKIFHPDTLYPTNPETDRPWKYMKEEARFRWRSYHTSDIYSSFRYSKTPGDSTITTVYLFRNDTLEIETENGITYKDVIYVPNGSRIVIRHDKAFHYEDVLVKQNDKRIASYRLTYTKEYDDNFQVDYSVTTISNRLTGEKAETRIAYMLRETIVTEHGKITEDEECHNMDMDIFDWQGILKPVYFIKRTEESPGIYKLEYFYKASDSTPIDYMTRWVDKDNVPVRFMESSQVVRRTYLH